MPERYLAGHVNDVSEDEVIDRLGEPTERLSASEGRSEWLYRQYVSSRGAVIAAEDQDCAQYRLTFDAKKVLREWTKEGC